MNNIKIKITFVLFFISWLSGSLLAQSTILMGDSSPVAVQTGDSFYDSGGSGGMYENYEDYTITFNAPVGFIVKVVFNQFNLENQSNCNYDWLKAFDGNSVSSASFGTYCGTSTPGTITSTGRYLTFQFHSDYSVVKSGWEATVEVVLDLTPRITSFTPSNACSNSNQVVTITGTNFTGATAVDFNGVAAASYTVNNNTQINATLPTLATSGTISVTTPQGTVISVQSFTVNPLPAAAGSITGTDIVLPGDTKSYVCASIANATSYEWMITGGGATITNNGTQADIEFASNASPGDRFLTVKGVNACGDGVVSTTFTIYVRPSYACQTTVINWDFDSPDLNGLDWKGYSTVNGWSSSLNNIEIWRNGFLGFTTVDGGQFCELNSIGVNEMWQNMITVPSTKMRWEITYRYRGNSSESIRIKIGAVGTLSNIADISNNNGDRWVTHSGFYTVPDGQTTTQFRIAALTPTGSSGNLIDNIQFYSIEPDIEDPTFTCPVDSDGDGFVVSECVDATSFVVNNINVTNKADNCTPVADLVVEYKITHKTTPASVETLLVNFGDDPAGIATSSDASGYAFLLGVSTVSYKITDASGHEANCNFKIEIKATPKPVGIFYE